MPARRKRVSYRADPLVQIIWGMLSVRELKVREFCDRAGVSHATLNNAVKGVHSPSLASVRAFLDELGLDLAVVKKPLAVQKPFPVLTK